MTVTLFCVDGKADDDPLVIGIGGGSGSGKSTIAAQLSDALAPLSVEIVNQDRFFKPVNKMPTYYSAHHDEQRPNFNHPESFHRHEMFDYCRESRGSDVVIIEGILALHFAELRSLMQIKCYVAIPPDQMLARRMARNLAAGYGGTGEEIAWYNTECVKPYHERFNAPTARHADVIIANGDGNESEWDDALGEICGAVRSAIAR